MKKAVKVCMILVFALMLLSCASTKKNQEPVTADAEPSLMTALPSWFTQEAWQGNITLVYTYYDETVFEEEIETGFGRNANLLSIILSNLDSDSQSIVDVDEESSYIAVSENDIAIKIEDTIIVNGVTMEQTINYSFEKSGEDVAISGYVTYFVRENNAEYLNISESGLLKKVQ